MFLHLEHINFISFMAIYIHALEFFEHWLNKLCIWCFYSNIWCYLDHPPWVYLIIVIAYDLVPAFCCVCFYTRSRPCGQTPMTGYFVLIWYLADETLKYTSRCHHLQSTLQVFQNSFRIILCFWAHISLMEPSLEPIFPWFASYTLYKSYKVFWLVLINTSLTHTLPPSKICLCGSSNFDSESVVLSSLIMVFHSIIRHALFLIIVK